MIVLPHLFLRSMKKSSHFPERSSTPGCICHSRPLILVVGASVVPDLGTTSYNPCAGISARSARPVRHPTVTFRVADPRHGEKFAVAVSCRLGGAGECCVNLGRSVAQQWVFKRRESRCKSPPPLTHHILTPLSSTQLSPIYSLQYAFRYFHHPRRGPRQRLLCRPLRRRQGSPRQVLPLLRSPLRHCPSRRRRHHRLRPELRLSVTPFPASHRTY